MKQPKLNREDNSKALDVDAAAPDAAPKPYANLPAFGQSWARDRSQRLRVEEWNIKQPKLSRENDSKALEDDAAAPGAAPEPYET